MKPIQYYDTVLSYPTQSGPSVAMGQIANQIIPLVVCLDGIQIDYPYGSDSPSWHHYQDVPPPQAMERIESLAETIAKHYPLS